MKIYTKTGDQGQTSLASGERVSKSHMRVEMCGQLDELNCWIGLLRAGLNEHLSNFDIDLFHQEIQEELFVLGGLISSPVEHWSKLNLNSSCLELVNKMEKKIDALEEELPPLKNFILPGGSTLAGQAHMCRIISRRVERFWVQMTHELEPKEFPPGMGEVLNRISDYFFILARSIAHRQGVAEVIWSPKLSGQ